MKATSHISRFLMLPVLLLGFALAGCDGDDGAAGPPGPPGPPGAGGPPGGGGGATVDIGNTQVIDPVITGVTITSPAVVNFTLTNDAGFGLVGLSPSAISFSIAKLVPGTNGNSSEWQNYITRVESPGGVGPGMQDEIQATTENGSNGVLVDNLDGTYVYTFATDLAAAAVPFDATATHRVGFEIRGGLPAAESNAAFTFRPDGMPVTFTREIVKIDNCNRCHNKLALHGNARFETQYCMTCHNPGSTDANSTNTIDAKVMIHKIHRGANLPNLINIGDIYSIFGFGDNEHIYGEAVDDGMGGVETEGLHLPMDIRNCRRCHDENDPETPDAINWLTVPTMEACGSCHADVNFMTGQGHSSGNIIQTDNTNCTLCHGPSGGVGPIDASHEILEQTAAMKYQYNVISVTDPMGGPVDPGDFPMVTFSVTDPTNGDAPYDIQNDPPFTQGGGASRVAIDLGWNTTDYSNTGSGSSSPSAMVSLNPLFGGSTDNLDGTFSITSGVAIPMNVTGTGLAAIEGHPAEDLDFDMVVERLPVTGATGFFAITDMTAQPRRAVVAIENCDNCHQQLSLHGSNRTDHIDLCVGCHNQNNTDIDRRPADPTTTPDGKREETIDFKRMIHKIHAANIYVYGFGGSLHDFTHVEFPGDLNNCANCHEDDTYYPVTNAVLATTIDTGADPADPLDDINISPNTSVCSSCHTATIETEHMKQNGGAFDVMQLADGTMISMSAGTVIETCDVCHGEDRIADIEVMHGFD